MSEAATTDVPPANGQVPSMSAAATAYQLAMSQQSATNTIPAAHAQDLSKDVVMTERTPDRPEACLNNDYAYWTNADFFLVSSNSTRRKCTKSCPPTSWHPVPPCKRQWYLESRLFTSWPSFYAEPSSAAWCAYKTVPQWQGYGRIVGGHEAVSQRTVSAHIIFAVHAMGYVHFYTVLYNSGTLY